MWTYNINPRTVLLGTVAIVLFQAVISTVLEGVIAELPNN